MSDFQTLGINKKLIRGLNELGIVHPTEVQEQAIPFLVEDGSDFVCRAQTGDSPSVWIADIDGQNPRELTKGLDDLGADHPRWMPQI